MPFAASPPHSSSTLSLHDALPISPVVSRFTIALGTASKGNTDVFTSYPFSFACSSVKPTVATVGFVNVTAGTTDKSIFLFNPPIARSEEHTSELQSRGHLVCRLLLRPLTRLPLSPYTTLFRSHRLFHGLQLLLEQHLKVIQMSSHHTLSLLLVLLLNQPLQPSDS